MPRQLCGGCKKSFREPADLANHIRSTKHRQRVPITVARDVCTQFRCCDCNREFVHERALMDHLRDKIHIPKAPARAQKRIPCGICRKFFVTMKAATDHRTSPIHKPFCAPLRCIDSKICKKIFNTPSALVLHLESGSCPSKLTRMKLNKIVLHHDTCREITHPGVLTPSTGRTTPDAWSDILTPPSPLPSLQSECCESPNSDREVHSPDDDWVFLSPDELSLSSRTVPRMCLEEESVSSMSSVRPSTLFICPLCPPTSNRFHTAKDLQSHESSPVHAPRIFYCPSMGNNKGKGAGKPLPRKFSTFSGLAMHIESGVCGQRMLQWILSEINVKLRDFGIGEVRLII